VVAGRRGAGLFADSTANSLRLFLVAAFGHAAQERAIPVIGKPDANHISTSFVERQNWSVRTAMRRYTRLSNGFSRKIENHAAAIALNYFAYNFIKIHRTLRVTPAMAAGVTDHLWDANDLVGLLEAEEMAKRAA